ncbi:hypothetical protein [Actinoplanes sp. NPDC049599]|uniref:hypothetical protein n=1 Tax=Actinoplanes sp. NPDC049599 TaxID=3363903 RepID=UPI0037A19AFD
MRNRRTTVLLGVLAAGALLSQQACTPVDRTSGGPVAFTTPPAESPTPVAASSAGSKPAGKKAGGKKAATGKAEDPILAGKRQIVIKPVPSFESIVVVDDRGRLTLTDGEAEHGLFVLTPSGGKHLIKTAKAGASGEPSCLGIKNNGTAPLTVEAAACDAGRAGQLFTITRQRAKTKTGEPTYAISNQSAFLQVFPQSGLIAEELGDAPLKTTYAFVDNGPSTLPILD